ncbi:MAG: sulfite exporter TauE/SafE family protein [Alphaproteobacteria bacterium]|nr:sulfite exporter TauE/SafE family protein [Alphaproteobacteria bacterium]
MAGLYTWAGQPFHDVAPWLVVLIAAIYLFAFFARGVLGFGAVAPIVIITSLLIDPHHAVLLALVAGTIPQLHMLPQGLQDGDWSIARPVLGAMMLGIPGGVWVFANMGTDWFTLVLGCVIFVIILADIGRLLDRALANVNIRALPTALSLSLVAGFVNGLAGAGGVVSISVYLRHACTNHVSLRATLVLVGTLLLCWRLVVTGIAGLYSVKLMAEALILLPIVYLGVWLGTRVFKTVTPERYHRLMQLLILVSALGLIVKGVSRLT